MMVIASLVVAVVSLFGAGVLAGVLTFVYFGSYWAQLWDEQIWDFDEMEEED